MNCSQCREEFGAYLEGLLDAPVRERAESHLAECPMCRAELEAVQQLAARLSRDAAAVGSVSLEDAVMDRIVQEQAIQLRRLRMRRRIRMLGISGVAAAAITLFALGSMWLARPAAAERTAAQVLAQGAEAVPHPSTVHIVAKMRTIAHGNFAVIGDKYDFVPVEIWKQFGEKPKWRVEKPGRVAVMDGDSTVMLIRQKVAVKHPQPSNGAFDAGWLLALTNVEDMVTHELRSAQARGWDLKLTYETTGAGVKKLLVTVEAKSGLPADDYLKNKSFARSDMRRVYRFDEKSRRLEGFDAYLHKSGRDVLILSIERIDYDKPFDAAVFKLKLPKDVVFYQEPQRLPDNKKYEKMTPEQAAQAFFEACGRKDWKEVEKFFSPIDERVKQGLGGLQLLSLGTPFKSKGYGGWFVPYEIKVSMTVSFVVCNDTPARRFVVLGAMRQDEDPNKLAELKQKLEEKLAKLEKLPDNEKYEKMTAKGAAEAYLEALVQKDAARAHHFSLGTIDDTKKQIQGPSIQSCQVGEPLQDEKSGLWQVPVEMYMIRKHNLALRSDNPAKRYVVDGGI